MRVCFADDEPLARERMRKMLALDEDIEICGEAQMRLLSSDAASSKIRPACAASASPPPCSISR